MAGNSNSWEIVLSRLKYVYKNLSNDYETVCIYLDLPVKNPDRDKTWRQRTGSKA